MKQTTLCQRLFAFGFLFFVAAMAFIGINSLFGITGGWKIITFFGAIHIPICLYKAILVLQKLEEETKGLPSAGGSEGWY